MDTETQEKVQAVVQSPGLKRLVFRKVVHVIVGQSISAVVVTALHRNTVDPENSKTQKVKLQIGTVVLGGAVSHAVKPYVNECVNDLYEFIDSVKKVVKGDEPGTVIQGEVIPDSTPSE